MEDELKNSLLLIKNKKEIYANKIDEVYSAINILLFIIYFVFIMPISLANNLPIITIILFFAFFSYFIYTYNKVKSARAQIIGIDNIINKLEEKDEIC